MTDCRNTEIKVRAYIDELELIPDNASVVMGVSGGADSVCMMTVLHELAKTGCGFRLFAVHVNHNLREEAGDDEAYVRKLCRDLEIPLMVKSADVKGRSDADGISCEEAGRRLRYEAFDEAAELISAGRFPESKAGPADREDIRIAVAHTSDDCAETMLLNLWRGTGLKGLCGIPAKRGDVIRPVMCLSREETEGYLDSKGIVYCTDKTNEGDDYTRNRIRHNIIPTASREVNSQAVAHMNVTAAQLTRAWEYIEDQTDAAYNECVRWSDDNETILFADKKKLLSCHPYIRMRILHRCMETVAGQARDISFVHLDVLEKLFYKGRGKRLDLPYFITATRVTDGVEITVNKDKELGKGK
ncbi:MAG: tRNA lysidine(34) synthetase TilS [Lachnospiraceae bacterium]|nr:tRNA lysidine(34) synthetase TilS [Lachnospiraceae bacterium]